MRNFKRFVAISVLTAMVSSNTIPAIVQASDDVWSYQNVNVMADDTLLTWDFSEYTSENSVTATGEQTVSYEGMEIHLNSGDTVSENGILWSSPGSTKSDGTVVSNNRYIKYTPTQNGELTLTFSGDSKGSGSNYPRMYIVSGDDTTCMSKNNSDTNGVKATATAIDTDTVITANMSAGVDYYIWPYCYNAGSVKFTVSSISYIEKNTPKVEKIDLVYKNGENTVLTNEIILENKFEGESYTYVSENYITGTDGKIYAVGNDYTTDTAPTATTGDSKNASLKNAVTLETDMTFTYDVTESPNVVFYSEWEDVLGGTASNCSNTKYVASGGMWTATNKTVPFYRVTETGTYQIVLVGGPKNRGTAIYATESIAQSSTDDADGTQLINFAGTGNSDTSGVYAVETVELEAGDNLTIRGFGSSNTSDNLDYVLVRRIYKDEIIGADGISILPAGIEEQYKLDADADSVEWSVTGVSGVTIDTDGKLTVSEDAEEGIAVITALASGKTYTKNVIISSAQIADFTLSGAEVIEKDGKAEYKAINVTDTFGRDITDKIQVTYTSSDASVLLIDENGTATSLKDDEATVTVKVTVGDSEKEKSVAVSPEVYTVIADATGDSTVVDTSMLVKSNNISGYLVTTATDGGVLVNQVEADVSDNVTVNTINADKVEITPIFTYSNVTNITDGYKLAEQHVDGRYNITVKKADTTKADIMMNGLMVGNDVDRTGTSRSGGDASEYTSYNVNVTGGVLAFSLVDCPETAEVDEIELKKSPSIVNRKSKITILGSSTASTYYGNRTNKDLGSNQHGWGERLYRYIDTAKYDVVNLAGDEMSVRDIYQTVFKGALQNSEKGDIIICECGYSDLLASTQAEMEEYMEKMSAEAEENEVKLIFLTSIVSFDSEENYNTAPALTLAVKEKAEEMGNEVIDMASISYNYLSALYGTAFETAKSSATANYMLSDGVNLSFAGATKFAELIAKELRTNGAVTSFNKQYEYITKDSKGNAIYASMNDDNSFDKYTVFKDDKYVGVTITSGEATEVALYAGDGGFVDKRTFTEPQDKAYTVKFNRPQEDGYIIKINESTEIEVDSIQRAKSDAVDNMEYATYSASTSRDEAVTYSHTMPYRYYLPQNYDSEKSYPIIMYLHGAGRRGSDNNDQLINGQYIVNSLLSEKYLNNESTECIIVTPQCPSSKKWLDISWSTGSYNYDEYAFNETLHMAYDIILDFTDRYSVNMDKIYISGQSMGGYGTWRMAAEHPEVFAAAIPLCSGGPKDEKGAGAMASVNLPVWAFHGSADSTVPVSGSQDMVAALESFGATGINYTELTGRNHEIQGEVFTTTAQEVGLYEWLFSQTKGEEPQPVKTPEPTSTPTATVTPVVTVSPTVAPTVTPTPVATSVPDPTTTPSVNAEITLEYDTTERKITALSNDSGVKNAVLINAVYNEDDSLNNVSVYPLEFTDKVAEVADVELNAEDKLFVWDSIEGMKPLSDAVLVKDVVTPVTESTTKPTTEPSASPIPTIKPTTEPTISPTEEPKEGYTWDFTTDQTATSGNNVPVISGNAIYDETNQNVKYPSDTKDTGALTVNLKPAMEGVVTAEFDLNVAGLGGQTFSVIFTDSNNAEVSSLSFERYNHIAEFKVGETIIATDSEITTYINSTTSNNGGMDADATHFKFEINYPKKSAELTITASATKSVTYTGALDNVSDIAVFTAKSERTKTASRPIHLDNLSLDAYMPSTAFYATGSTSVTKRMGMDVTQQYEISKTYADDSEVYEWSVSGVEGVTIDSETGVLTVSETAQTGKVTVTATLVNSATLPVGTTSSLDVTIDDFASVDTYEISGATTLETGTSSQLSLDSVADADGNDITEFAFLSGFMTDNTDVAEVTADGLITAKTAGTAIISATLSIEKMGIDETVTIPVKTGIYQITSSESQIDVSEMTSYGSDTFRVYSVDGYETVTVTDNIVSNTTGSEVTVVPVYKLNFRNTALDGYTDANVTYSNEIGYGLVSGANYNVNEKGAKATEGSPLKVDLPSGRYDLEITRAGSRADIYTNGCQIVNNTSSGEQNRSTGTSVFEIPEVLVESGNLNLTIGNISSGGGERISELIIASVPSAYSCPTIYVAGDSESANYFPRNTDGDDLESDKLMMTGFGMQLEYFMADYYGVSNMGQPSATSGTWYDECFESVLYQIKEGDIFIMDFGINEVSSKTNSMTQDAMEALLSEMAQKVREKGAQPVLLSPVYCGKYQAQSYFTYDTETGTNDAADFAEEIGIPFIDINKYLTLYINQAIEETGDENWRQNNYQVTKDNLHITQFGALLTASFISAGLDELGYETTDFAFTYSDNSSVEDGYVRGGDTGVTRVYSVETAKEFMQNN